MTDPATGEKLAEHALADAADVDRAVQAARRVHLSDALTAMRPIERGRMVQAMGRYLIEHKDEIARTLTLEQGKPLWESHIEVEGAALYFEYYGNQARAAEAAGFPPGAVNVLCGLGRDAGAALAGHADVNQIVFTGSVPTGIAIATAAAQNVVPCMLELGGKSAAIVHADADLRPSSPPIQRRRFVNPLIERHGMLF